MDKKEIDKVVATGKVLAALIDYGMTNEEIKGLLTVIANTDVTLQLHNLREDKKNARGLWRCPEGIIL